MVCLWGWGKEERWGRVLLFPWDQLERGSFFTFLAGLCIWSEGLGPAGGLLLGAWIWGREVRESREWRGEGRVAATSWAEFFPCQGVQMPDHHTRLVWTQRNPFLMKENQGIALGQHYLTQQLPKPPCQAITPSACIIWARVGRGPPSGGLRGDQPPPTRCAQGAIYPKKTEEESPGGTTWVSFSPAAHLAPEIASENTVLGLWDKTAWTKPPAPERFQGWAAACTAPSPPLGPPNSPQIHLSLSSPNLLSLISLAGREQSPSATSGTLGTAGNYAQMRLPPMWKPLLLGCAACILIACTRACLVVSNSVQPHGL